MIKKISSYFSLAFLVLAYTLPFYAVPQLAAAQTGCTITVFWHWKDGKDYATPPTTPAPGDQVGATAQFQNCQSNSGDVAYFMFYTPSGGAQRVGLTPLTQSFSQQTATYTFNGAGDSSFKAFAETATGNFEKGSSVVTAKFPTNPTCNMAIQFNATPSKLSSVDQTTNLTAVISQKTQTCGIAVFTLTFSAGSTVISTQTRLTAQYGIDRTVNFQTLAASGLGYKQGDTISFSATASGSVDNGSGVQQNINLVSSPVNVGVGVDATPTPPNPSGVPTPPNPSGLPTPPNNNPATTASAWDCNANPDPAHCIINPLPLDSLTGMVLYITKGFTLIVGIWAVLFIMIGGFRMVMAQGDEEAYTTAKKTVTWAVLGVVVALLSYSMVAIVQNFLGAQAPQVKTSQNISVEKI